MYAALSEIDDVLQRSQYVVANLLLIAKTHQGFAFYLKHRVALSQLLAEGFVGSSPAPQRSFNPLLV